MSQAEYKRTLYLEAVKAGLCVMCRRRSSDDGKTRCATCRARQNDREGKRGRPKSDPTLCLVVTCLRPAAASRLCRKHYDAQPGRQSWSTPGGSKSEWGPADARLAAAGRCPCGLLLPCDCGKTRATLLHAATSRPGAQ